MKEKLFRSDLMMRLNQLTYVKEKLQIDLMCPMLKWNERMELNLSLQSINKRIEQLNLQLRKRPSA